LPNDLIDFASNDYLGFLSQRNYFLRTEYLIKNKSLKVATGSFLSGTGCIRKDFIANFHQTETALIFNSGCDAIGFFSAVPQEDLIL
jgi:8-amino-7-oxononanoate synthase